MISRIGEWQRVGRYWHNVNTGRIIPVIAGGALPYTDAFTDTDGVDLTTHSANWTYNNAGDGTKTLLISTNAIRPNSSGVLIAAHINSETFSDGQYAKGTIAALTTIVYIGVAVRCISSSTRTFYSYYGNSTDSNLDVLVAGTSTNLGNSLSWSVSDVVGLYAFGTTITPKINDVVDAGIGQQTDSSITSGYAGIVGLGASTSIRLDNFEGGNYDGTFSINKSESITVTDTPFPGGALVINKSESIGVSEFTAIHPRIYYVTQSTTDITVATASPIITAPTVTDEDLIIIVFATNTSANVAASAGGFTRLGTEVDQAADATTGVLYKIASGEGANWTLTNLFDNTEIGRFVVLVYRNTNASPFNVNAQSDLGSVTTATGPSITTTTENTMVVQFVGADPGTGAYSATPDASPVATERFDGKDASSNAYIAVQEYWNSAIGAIALDMTVTSDGYGAHQFAIQPKITPAQFENIAVSEVVAAEVVTSAYTINKSEAITVTESHAESVGTSQVNKSETIATTESTGQLVVSFVNVSDAAAVAESITAQIVNTVNVNDALAVTESHAESVGTSQVNKSEAVGVAESHAETVGTSQVNVSDAIGVTESHSEAIVTTVNKSEAVSVTESHAETIGTSQVSVSDAISTAESKTVVIEVLINKSDAVTIAESHAETVGAPQINVSETTSIAESITALVEVLVNKSESLGVTEVASVLIGTPQIATAENIAVTESTAQAVSAPQINVSDAATLTEAVTLEVQALGTTNVNKQESVTVAESADVTVGTSQVNNLEAVTLAENLAVVTGAPQVDKSDNLTLAENTAVLVGDPQVNKSDAVTVAESISVQIGVTTLTVAVTEAVSLSDAVVMAFEAIAIQAQDNISLAEQLFAGVGTSQIGVSDTIGITDAAQLIWLSGIAFDFTDPRLVFELRKKTVFEDAKTTIFENGKDLEFEDAYTLDFERRKRITIQ